MIWFVVFCGPQRVIRSNKRHFCCFFSKFTCVVLFNLLVTWNPLKIAWLCPNSPFCDGIWIKFSKIYQKIIDDFVFDLVFKRVEIGLHGKNMIPRTYNFRDKKCVICFKAIKNRLTPSWRHCILTPQFCYNDWIKVILPYLRVITFVGISYYEMTELTIYEVFLNILTG